MGGDLPIWPGPNVYVLDLPGPCRTWGRHSSPGISPPDRSRQLSCLLGLPSRQAGYVPYRQRVSRAVGSPVPQPPCLVSPRLGRTVGTHGARTQRAACAGTSLFLERADWQNDWPTRDETVLGQLAPSSPPRVPERLRSLPTNPKDPRGPLTHAWRPSLATTGPLTVHSWFMCASVIA
jgi:hypothetical protein